MAAGLSLRVAAAASGSSKSRLWRFERGDIGCGPLTDLGAWFAVLGVDLVVKAYPAGDPIRDGAQLALLERLRAQLHPSLHWRAEVPLPIMGDLRAWDAEVRGSRPGPWRCRIEAETRVSDAQALERRLTLKDRDDPEGHLILLVADTRTNRRAIVSFRADLRELLPLGPRAILAALRAGADPDGSGIVIP